MSQLTVRRAWYSTVAVAATLVLSSTLQAQQSAASDWTPPSASSTQATGMHLRLGYLRETFPAPAHLLNANGVAVAAGWGHEAGIQRGFSLGYGITRSESYEGLTPGQSITRWQAAGLVAPRLARLGKHSDLRVTLSGGVRAFDPSARAGVVAAPSTFRWQAGVGPTLRLGSTGPMSVVVDAHHVWRDISVPAFASAATPALATREWWQWRVGIMIHNNARDAAPADLRRYPAGDGANGGRATLLQPETGVLSGHVDGAAPLGSAGRPNARYMGPQTLTVYFKEQSTAFADSTDYDKLVRLAAFLAEVPGTVIVMRSWETPAANPVAVRQMAEQRADRLRDIILAAAPFAAPQRVTSILMGGDFARTDNARTRRIDLEFFRP